MGRIGATELIVLFFFLAVPFFIGYFFGKKSGYIKRVHEEDQKK